MKWLDNIYKKGYEAGVNAQKVTDHEDQNRRLAEMLKYGKEIGRHDGFVEGYKQGYEVGYSEASAEIEEIDGSVFDEFEADMEANNADLTGGDTA